MKKKPTPNNVLRTATGSPIEQSSSPVKGGEQGPRLDASLLEEERYKYYDPFVEGSY